MFAATYDVRLASETDLVTLNGLAELDPHGPLTGPALVGYMGGEPAAAVSLNDGRIVADPRRRTDSLVACIQIRAAGLRAYEKTPSLRMRMLAGLSSVNHDHPSQQRREIAEGAARGKDRSALRAPRRSARRRSATTKRDRLEENLVAPSSR